METIRIPDEKIDLFREWFDASLPTFNDYQWQVNKPILKNLYNITEDRYHQTKRGEIKDEEMRQEIFSTVAEFGLSKKVDRRNAYMNFARGFLPIAIHVDVPADNIHEDGNTILIPLTFDDRIKTFWWKEKVYEPVFDYWIEKQNWDQREKVNNISEQYDVRNGYFPKPDVTDYMELDGIGEWFKGNCFCGRRSQPHCSNNFKTSGIEYKDYILIQTTDQLHRDE